MKDAKWKGSRPSPRDASNTRRGRDDRGSDQSRPRLTSNREQPHIWGIHAATAALANQRRQIRRVLATAASAARAGQVAKARGLEIETVETRDLDRLLGPDTVHQGLLVIAELLPEPALEDLVDAARQGGPLIVLDQVTDPHNVGAILRSAAVFGASGLLMTHRHSPPLDGALAKAASGALELVPIALVPNLARTLDDLEEVGVFRLGLAGEADAELSDARIERPVAIVLGSEGEGLRRLTREHCSTLVRIGAPGSLASLNVSNAAAVSLYALTMQLDGARLPK